MAWKSCKETLPKEFKDVLVIRVISLPDVCDGVTFQVYDIGHIEGSRWKLQSQQFSPLPVSPMVSANIISHWMNLPKKPKTDDKEI